MTSEQLEQQVRTRLAETSVRFTRGRRALIAALASADGPMSAAEIHERVGQAIPLSSLYRSLATLSSVGVLAPHHGSQGVTRYELAEWLVGHHHHLVCIDCGNVDDVELEPEHESALQDLVKRVAPERFVAIGHALEIDGRCAQCA